LYVTVKTLGSRFFATIRRLFAVAESERRFGNTGRADEVDVLAGDGKEPGREDEPAHMAPEVVVAGMPAPVVHEGFFEEEVNDVGGLVGAAA